MHIYIYIYIYNLIHPIMLENEFENLVLKQNQSNNEKKMKKYQPGLKVAGSEAPLVPVDNIHRD
jgi:hypothetical protein